MKDLFRKEVLDSRKHNNYGGVYINTPQKYSVITSGIVLLTICLLLLIIWGEYSEKFIVQGYLNFKEGVVRIHPKLDGVVTKMYIKQGDKVRKGDPLFLIDTSSHKSNKNSYHSMLGILRKRKTMMDNEIAYKSAHLQALKGLLTKGYISLKSYNDRHDELVAIENNKNLLEMDLIKYQQEQSYLIRSPIDGVISNVLIHEGQYTHMLKALAKILPGSSDLVAELFVPVMQSGFLENRNKVIIHFDAYPYQYFGSSTAVITEISQSVLTDKEEEKPISINLPYYKIIANLDKQYLNVYGKQKKIQHGMTVSAVIVGKKRKIWQWIFTPFYQV